VGLVFCFGVVCTRHLHCGKPCERRAISLPRPGPCYSLPDSSRVKPREGGSPPPSACGALGSGRRRVPGTRDAAKGMEEKPRGFLQQSAMQAGCAKGVKRTKVITQLKEFAVTGSFKGDWAFKRDLLLPVPFQTFNLEKQHHTAILLRQRGVTVF